MATRPRRHRAALLALWLLGGVCVAPECGAQSLFEIPTTSSTALSVPDDQPLAIALQVRDPAALAQVLGVATPPAGSTRLTYVMDGYPVIHGPASRSWLESTFVIDFREPSVAEVSAELAKSVGNSPPAAVTPAAIVQFVSGLMKGSQNRGFDIASEVAVRREGDCTEYAVLTAALARGAGIPARVVLGLALVRRGSSYMAYGHAWAELQTAGRWIVADSALARMKNPVRYLPFGVLENEGMGFELDVARLTPVWVQRIEVLGKPRAAVD
ncbi:MAG TPA: transglutaminase domain-containing protein [Steroidobacteraceae bacterium]|nr:transglutaminase domain-containing protein [Steroidobacteraceae bacterium]